MAEHTMPTEQHNDNSGRKFKYNAGDQPLDGYTIKRGVGWGGFGEVYYATSDSGREVALKFVQGAEQVELRGISQCMNLKNPHLVMIFDIKATDKEPVVIMEYVNGPSLRDLLNEAPEGLGHQKAAYLIREIAKGLNFLHDCGIVHRDLKPGNIFYEDGYVKIGDYGLSKAIGASTNSAHTITVGTVHYMAPEIGSGKYDRSIDIYALGIVFYEMLTGKLPFTGESAGEVLMKHATSGPDTTHLPEPYAKVIRKAMAKNPDHRYATVQEMIEDLFDTDTVRNSVSQFRPESISVAAQRVVPLPGQPVNAYSKAGPATDPKPAPATPPKVDIHIPPHQTPPPPPHQDQPSPDPAPKEIKRFDPMSIAQRRLFSIAALVAIAFVYTATWAQDFAAGFHLFLMSGVLTLSVMLARNIVSQRNAYTGHIQPMHPFSQRMLPAAFAFFSAVLVNSIANFNTVNREMIVSFCLGLGIFALDWNRRTNPLRFQRVDFASLATAMLVGLVLGFFASRSETNNLIPFFITAFAATNLASQLAATWLVPVFHPQNHPHHARQTEAPTPQRPTPAPNPRPSNPNPKPRLPPTPSHPTPRPTSACPR